MSALWITFCVVAAFYLTRRPKPADPTCGGRLVSVRTPDALSAIRRDAEARHRAEYDLIASLSFEPKPEPPKMSNIEKLAIYMPKEYR